MFEETVGVNIIFNAQFRNTLCMKDATQEAWDITVDPSHNKYTGSDLNKYISVFDARAFGSFLCALFNCVGFNFAINSVISICMFPLLSCVMLQPLRLMSSSIMIFLTLYLADISLANCCRSGILPASRILSVSLTATITIWSVSVILMYICLMSSNLVHPAVVTSHVSPPLFFSFSNTIWKFAQSPDYVAWE